MSEKKKMRVIAGIMKDYSKRVDTYIRLPTRILKIITITKMPNTVSKY